MCEFIVKFFEEIKIFKSNIQPFIDHCKNKNICPSKSERIGKGIEITTRFDLMQKPTNNQCNKDQAQEISIAIIKPKINAMNYLSVVSETLINARILQKNYKNAKIFVWFITLTHQTKPIEVEINQMDKLRDIIVDLVCDQLEHVGTSIKRFINARVASGNDISTTKIRDDLKKILKTENFKQNKTTRKFTLTVLQKIADRTHKASKITDDILNEAVNIAINAQKKKLRKQFKNDE
jgi:hypothetical protein